MIRFFDLLLSALGIVLLFPLILVITLLNMFETGGKPFFIQLRVGKNDKEFSIIKFRTMLPGSANKSLLTIGKKDARITGIGYYLRKFKLDEIPQLFNVFTGKMSLVGPRPEVRKYVDLYTEEQRRVLLVKPGITDYASIEYISENEILEASNDPEKTYIEEIMPRKIELSQKYISTLSLRHYFMILILTVQRLIFGTRDNKSKF